MKDWQWSVFNHLFEANCFIILAGISTFIIFWLNKKQWINTGHHILAKGSQGLMLLALLFPFLPFDPYGSKFLKPLLKNYNESGSSWGKTFGSVVTLDIMGDVPLLDQDQISTFVSGGIFIGLALILSGVLFLLFKLWRSNRSLNELIQDSIIIRRKGTLKIYLSPKLQSPFALRTLRSQYVFMPPMLKKDFYVALGHELQHHRAGDTTFAYISEFFKSIYFYNPIVWWWTKLIDQLQELACDEVLIGRKGISSLDYSATLLKVAEPTSSYTPVKRYEGLVGTAGLSARAKILKWRILAMKRKRNFNKLRTAMVSMSFLCIGLSAAFASKHLAQKQTISFDDAQKLVARTNSKSAIPVYMDQKVLKWLNWGVGTKRGRNYLKSSLKRMKRYKAMIETHIEKYNLPDELMAVPLHESGFQDYDNGVASGIWSFTPGTARNYGVRVNDNVDERSDAKKLTVAAMKYYTDLINIKKFSKNWHLALIAYNSGERRLLGALREVGSTDARVVIEKARSLSKENKAYLPKFMANLIVLKNPELLD